MDRIDYIVNYLSEKGWSKNDIERVIFDVASWTEHLKMPIESYYSLFMTNINVDQYLKWVNETIPNNAAVGRKYMFLTICVIAGFILLGLCK